MVHPCKHCSFTTQGGSSLGIIWGSNLKCKFLLRQSVSTCDHNSESSSADNADDVIKFVNFAISALLGPYVVLVFAFTVDRPQLQLADFFNVELFPHEYLNPVWWVPDDLVSCKVCIITTGMIRLFLSTCVLTGHYTRLSLLFYHSPRESKNYLTILEQ